MKLKKAEVLFGPDDLLTQSLGKPAKYVGIGDLRLPPGSLTDIGYAAYEDHTGVNILLNLDLSGPQGFIPNPDYVPPTPPAPPCVYAATLIVSEAEHADIVAGKVKARIQFTKFSGSPGEIMGGLFGDLLSISPETIVSLSTPTGAKK